ncbi:hypothetical protein FHW12_000818 [Dokdonella fugitiva]|uniref:Uncharacterized protein n=1 Tax=Dokdonella fugitiva TaxID=328517 RepID=A0A839EQN5_9GAMM|nr:hypothetical protein [Dokdonella fugitiva]MBA8886627.1 hypothetical protein [Dokdonella fugitiva]
MIGPFNGGFGDMLRVLVAALVLIPCPVAPAQNLLANSDFAMSLDGWNVSTTDGSTVVWEAGPGHPTAGSAAFQTPTGSASLDQCVPYSGIDLEANVFVRLEDQHFLNFIQYGLIRSEFYSDEDCATQPFYSNTVIDGPWDFSGWLTLRSRYPFGDPTAHSVRFSIGFDSYIAGGAYVDHAELVPAGSLDPLSSPPANRVENADFDAFFSPWRISRSGNGGVLYDGTDGYPSPGSMALSVTGAGDQASIAECVVIASPEIDVEWLTQRSIGSDDPLLTLAYFDNEHCTGSMLGTEAVAAQIVVGEWDQHSLLNHALPVATRAVSMTFSYATSGSPKAALVDHVSMQASVAGDDVFVDGFD